MKLCLLILLQVLTICAHAQGDDAMFTVNARVQLNPPIDSLIGGRVYHFNITGLALKDIVAATITNGRAVVSATEITVWPNSTERQVRSDSLRIYINKEGRYFRVFDKVFTVVTVPQVLGDISGSSNQPWIFDSSIIEIVSFPSSRYDTVSASEIAKNPAKLLEQVIKNKETKIVSFRLDIACNGSTKRFVSNSKMLTPAMRQALQQLVSGCIIRLYDMQCAPSAPYYDPQILGPYYIVIIK